MGVLVIMFLVSILVMIAGFLLMRGWLFWTGILIGFIDVCLIIGWALCDFVMMLEVMI